MCCGCIRHDELNVMHGDYEYQNEIIQIKDSSRNNFNSESTYQAWFSCIIIKAAMPTHR